MHIARLSIADALASLHSSASGLSAAEAERRLCEYGPNSLAETRAEAHWPRLLREFTHFFALILWLAAGLAFFAEISSPGEGMGQLGVAIVAVILINGGFSFWQEFRAERAITALRRLLPQTVEVLRDNRLLTLPAAALVPGDLIVLREGDNVPADCRLIAGDAVRVNASTITGEAQPVARRPDSVAAAAAHDAANLLLAGTWLVSGQGRAIVFATGMRTEVGRIARLTQGTAATPSHLQQEITRLSRLVALLAAALGGLFFAIGTLIGLPFWANLMFAIGIIVANVPEGLLPTVTLSLAMATQRMARRNALVRHLPAVETLGATTVICSDKTGTLTQNRMRVRQVCAGRHLLEGSAGETPTVSVHLRRSALLCHQLRRGPGHASDDWLGDPTEVALVAWAAQAAPENPPRQLGTLPFDSERRRMSVVVEQQGERWLYCKGAPEAVLAQCRALDLGDSERPLDAALRERLAGTQEAMADRGQRVLAFAYRRLATDEVPQENELVLSGLIGLDDPPRPEVPGAIGRCRSAGIKVIMLTGDHPHTALAVGREIGLVEGAAPAVLLGEQLRRLSTTQLQLALDQPEIICARLSPADKLLVVEALKAKGEVVAVTGDGVNDAPALKAAHIGVAMGLTGTDVARSAADVILLDDNFASIVNAVEEGRAVFENIRKFLTYILTSNIPELVPYLAYALFRIPLPLTVIQILAVDLGTDMLPALALGAERPDPALMRQPPRAPGERLLSWPLLARAYLWLGTLEAGIALAGFFFILHAAGWQYGNRLAAADPLYLQATSACLAAIVVAQMVNLFVCRHPRLSALSFSLTANPLLGLGLAVELALLLLIIYAPFGNALFGTQPFDPRAWILIVLLAVAYGIVEEARKALVRRRLRAEPS